MAGKKQYDPDAVLEAAMLQFWTAGFADTTVDDLSAVTGLNRSSIYSSLGDKESLYLRCLDRYVTRYGDSYDTALSCAGDDPMRAFRQFFDVTMTRIADPNLPDGCLVAQTAMSIPVLSARIVEHAETAFGLQRARLRTALDAAHVSDRHAEDMSSHLAAVNHSLAVMSRVGADERQLQSIVDISLGALSHVLTSPATTCADTWVSNGRVAGAGAQSISVTPNSP